MQPTKPSTPFATLSLLSISLTVIFASITHAYEFGYRAFIAGLILLFLSCALIFLYRRTKKPVFLLFYGLLNVFMIIGFGLVNGLWNHTFKVFLNFLHNGYLPPFLAQLFSNPQIGCFFYEGAGMLTFVASMFAAYHGYKLIQVRKQFEFPNN